MSTLTQNIDQAISDFDSIRSAIVRKGVSVPTGTPTSRYSEKISDILTPSGTIDITTNGVIDVTSYATAHIEVAAPTAQIDITQNGTVDVSRYGVANVQVQSETDNILKKLIMRDSSLSSFTIPNGVTKIGDGAFYSFTMLTSITFNGSETRIGSQAFSKTHLINVVLPNHMQHIGSEAFYYCDWLQSIVIPVATTTIASNAFKDCDSLYDIYYEGTQQQWEAIDGLANSGIMSGATIHYNYTG